MIISVHHFCREPEERWTHSGEPDRHWRTIAQATQAALDWSRAAGIQVEGFTGHADRKILKAAGLSSRRQKDRPAGKANKLRSLYLDVANKKIGISEFIARARAIFAGPETPETWAASEMTLPEPPAPAPVPITRTTRVRTAAQNEALSLARLKRKIAAERTPPEGYRSVQHFLDDLSDYVGSHSRPAHDNLPGELAKYCGVGARTARAWIAREKVPLQDRLDLSARWLLSKKAGL